jgi:hypothetical protein
LACNLATPFALVASPRLGLRHFIAKLFFPIWKITAKIRKFLQNLFVVKNNTPEDYQNLN